MKKRNKVRPDYGEITIQEEPYQFGKYPKRRYWLHENDLPVYHFTTTCRSYEDAFNECMKKKDEFWLSHIGSFKVYMKENGVLKRIYREFRKKPLKNEKEIILPEDYLDIRAEKKDIKNQISAWKWQNKKNNKKNKQLEVTDKENR